jgi:hypothetical protein
MEQVFLSFPRLSQVIISRAEAGCAKLKSVPRLTVVAIKVAAIVGKRTIILNILNVGSLQKKD